jgi:hypothetical protein
LRRAGALQLPAGRASKALVTTESRSGRGSP